MSEAYDGAFDVVVVGFGGAGACAAIAAADAGARVLVLDRGYGGGSTYHSGGVVYAGGGTDEQKAGGVVDTPEDMLSYLQIEADGIVADETLKRFVDDSPAMIRWLEQQGLEWEGSVCPYKTSYPTNRHYLYYSGNELAGGYAEVAKPAPRGHRTRAKNFSGATFYNRLRDSALSKGVVFRPLAEVRDLIIEHGRVVGVEYLAVEGEPGDWYRSLTALAAKLSIWYPPVGSRMSNIVERRRRRLSSTQRTRAGAVVLSTGGHSFNREVVATHAPKWSKVPPLGTIGDDGANLRLGAQVNAKTAHLESMSGWRFISPPSSFMEGIVVGRNGIRFANEQLYGATMAKPLIEDNDSNGYLVMDARAWKRARGNLREQTAFFHAPQVAYLFGPLGHVKAKSLAELAGKIGVDAAGLIGTITSYNAAIAGGAKDEFGKHEDFRKTIGEAPFYAIDISIPNSPAYPAAAITLGGLVVDEVTGEVVDNGGSVVQGLYAAGRAAVGICSRSYVSGLSLADAVFSGRRAGEHAAARMTQSPQGA